MMANGNAFASTLAERIGNRTARIGVIGLGYVGLPLSLRFAEAGYRVLGLDIDEKKSTAINAGRSYFMHIPSSRVSSARSAGFEATNDFSRVSEADALIICVPTPLNPCREPDLSFVIDAMEILLPHLRAGQLISLGSTTYPGTTEEELKPRIEKQGFKVGGDFFLCFSPEREDPGNPTFTTQNFPKI